METKLKERQLYFIAIISVALLILANQFIIQKLLREIKGDSLVINFAGKQRMLPHKITELVYKSIDNEKYIAELKKENEFWNTIHQGLQYGNPYLKLPENTSESIAELFEEITPYQQAMYTAVKSIESSSDIEALLPVILENEEAYLPLMNTIVYAFGEKSEAKVKRLVIIEIILAAVSLLVLWLEFKLIFQPIVRELKNNSKKLEELNESKDRILATVAHDIRGPISGVQGTMEILKSDAENLNDEQKVMIDLSLESCIKAEKLIQELLDISLLESSEFHLETELIHLEQYVKSVLRQFEYKASEKNIELKLNIVPQDASVEIDKDRFSRVLENLITNALKFTNDSGKVALEAYEKEDKVLIKIEDNGIGIPEQLKEYIFDKFSKARRLGTKGETTTGLGMSIVKTIVEKHNGKIWLESQEGKGTAFYIRLPKND